MARYIDAELFANRLLNAWDTADKEKKTEIVAILSDIVTPILVGTPTADVAPRAEVAREIFKEIEAILEYWYSATANTYDGTILTHITDLKKKYTQTEGEV